MRISLDLMVEKYASDQSELIDWCFANLQKFTWGVKSVAGITCLYFDNPSDVEKFVERFAD
jgi:hypothetical protein